MLPGRPSEGSELGIHTCIFIHVHACLYTCINTFICFLFIWMEIHEFTLSPISLVLSNKPHQNVLTQDTTVLCSRVWVSTGGVACVCLTISGPLAEKTRGLGVVQQRFIRGGLPSLHIWLVLAGSWDSSWGSQLEYLTCPGPSHIRVTGPKSKSWKPAGYHICLLLLLDTGRAWTRSGEGEALQWPCSPFSMF